MTQPVPRRASAGRQLKAAAFLVLLLAGVLGVAYGVYYVTVGRPLLSGEHDHDFGIVEVAGSGQAVSVSHTFVLSNRTGKPVTIQDIKTSCSCSVASLSTETVEPGGTIEIKAQLSMNQDGRKRAKVFLNCGADVVAGHIGGLAVKSVGEL